MPEYVDWFVDRDKQFKGFLRMLARETEKAIMAVQAPAGMGKTWLIQHVRHTCGQRQVPCARIDFRDRQDHDYLKLTRQIRDQLETPHFNLLTETINQATRPSAVHLHTGGVQGDFSMRDVASRLDQVKANQIQVEIGHQQVIKDNFYNIQMDDEISRRRVRMLINDAFFTCLKSLAAEQVTVLLFDSFEDAPKEAVQWLREELLLRVRDGQLKNVLVIMAGRKMVDFDEKFKPVLARTGLDILTKEDICEYIQQRRKITDLDLETVIKTSGGLPNLLGMMADAATVGSQADDDEWF